VERLFHPKSLPFDINFLTPQLVINVPIAHMIAQDIAHDSCGVQTKRLILSLIGLAVKLLNLVQENSFKRGLAKAS
jgi:hypothetical protein